VKAVEAEAKKLNEQGVKIIIALGHAGIKFDLEIAEIPYVDIVVGGLSSLFTYTGTISNEIVLIPAFCTI